VAPRMRIEGDYPTAVHLGGNRTIGSDPLDGFQSDIDDVQVPLRRGELNPVEGRPRRGSAMPFESRLESAATTKRLGKIEHQKVNGQTSGHKLGVLRTVISEPVKIKLS